MKIAIASDHAGFEVKQALSEHLRKTGHEVVDHGCHEAVSCDYPDLAATAARSVATGNEEIGILLCGTGIGMSMAANKVPGIRAALVHDAFTAEMSRRHNDANVLCMGARVLGEAKCLELADLWLQTPFEGGRHARRVGKIDALDGAPATSDSSLETRPPSA